MASRSIILVDIGAAPLPEVTPPPRFWSSRLGTPVYNAPVTSPPPSVVLTAYADGILIVWEPSPNAGARYLVAAAADVKGQPGAWEVIADQAGTRYAAAVPTSAPRWYRVQAIAPNGVPSAWTPAQQATAVSVSALAVNLAAVAQTANEVRAAITTGVIAQQITGLIDSSDSVAWTSVAQALALSKGNDAERASKAYIKRLDLTKATPEQASAIAEQIVGAEIGPVSAKVDQTSQSLVNLNGALAATWSVRTEISDGNHVVMASMGLGVTQEPGQPAQSQILFYADKWGFMTRGANGAIVLPFYQDGLNTYIQNAIIADGSITNAKIGGVIESNNYVPGVSGWKIDKNGDPEFNNGIFRGDLTARSITGNFQANATIEWTGNLSSNPGATVTTFSCPAPVRDGEAHRPEISCEVVVSRQGGDDASGATLYLERQDVVNGPWYAITQRTYGLGKYQTIPCAFVFMDVPQTQASTYRFRFATSTGDTLYITGIHGRVIGQRTA